MCLFYRLNDCVKLKFITTQYFNGFNFSNYNFNTNKKVLKIKINFKKFSVRKTLFFLHTTIKNKNLLHVYVNIYIYVYLDIMVSVSQFFAVIINSKGRNVISFWFLLNIKVKDNKEDA